MGDSYVLPRTGVPCPRCRRRVGGVKRTYIDPAGVLRRKRRCKSCHLVFLTYEATGLPRDTYVTAHTELAAITPHVEPVLGIVGHGTVAE